MDIHQNAQGTPAGREGMVHSVLVEGCSCRSMAAEMGTSTKTVAKWVRRYQAKGRRRFARSPFRPPRSPRRTAPALVKRVFAYRRLRWTGKRIAQACGVSRATVSRILRRRRFTRARDLDPPRPANRYTHEAPADIVHLDVKKLLHFHWPGHRVTGDRSQDSGASAGSTSRWPWAMPRG